MPAAPIHHTATVDTPWDGAAAEKAFDKKPADFPKFYAWIDEGESDSDADGTDKEDGWGPHHEVDAEGVPGAANINAVHAAVAALNGAHGNKSRIPDSDRQGVFDHLVAHLKDAGVKAADLPELKSARPHVTPTGRRRQSRTLGPGREFRRFAASGLEVRAASGSDSITITGMPIMYDAPYQVCDMFGEFTETMHAGVATNVLATQPDVRFLFNHDGMPLARTLSGTLSLADTATGLSMTATLDARQQLACDLAVAIERGDVTQMSCGFVVAMDTWNADYTERDIWRLEQLFDVSAVTYPASPTTSIELALRSMMAAPVESRARLRHVWIAAREAREGKVLSAENAGLLQQALDALHEADDVDIPSIVKSLQTIDSALDKGQEAVSSVIGKANPDGDAGDKEPELTDNQDGTDVSPSLDPQVMQDGTGVRSADEPGETRAGFVPAPYHQDPDEVVVCPNCGLHDDVDARFCDQCGFQLIGAEDVAVDMSGQARSRNVALELELERMRLRGDRNRRIA